MGMYMYMYRYKGISIGISPSLCIGICTFMVLCICMCICILYTLYICRRHVVCGMWYVVCGMNTVPEAVGVFVYAYAHANVFVHVCTCNRLLRCNVQPRGGPMLELTEVRSPLQYAYTVHGRNLNS